MRDFLGGNIVAHHAQVTGQFSLLLKNLKILHGPKISDYTCSKDYTIFYLCAAWHASIFDIFCSILHDGNTNFGTLGGVAHAPLK